MPLVFRPPVPFNVRTGFRFNPDNLRELTFGVSLSVRRFPPEEKRRAGDRGELRCLAALDEEQFKDLPVPRPPHWGGYRLLPRAFEFWTGREDRLHERVRYDRTPDRWTVTLLDP